ncbi:DUF2569 domain-containing protein [Lentibacter algarum]|uniref:DUF2569 domain-containing protein n=1 Tax=Lentibacter algarum TaxID=576131 RepID=UPI001C078FE1|nr:DUF2569 domain-containing protein [Lentibacter algarum]MBU2982053.1 DUF2569 domain-containing protein [Lentibacter algarum]
MTDAPTPRPPLPIGGWLVLLAIGIVLSPFVLLIQVVPLYSALFSDSTYALLTTPSSEFYHAMWKPLLWSEMIFNGLFICAAIWIAYLFFNRKERFPKAYTVIAVFSLVFILGDAYAITLILPNEPMFDPETAKQLLRGVFTLCVWCPYVLISQRSKDTFML